MQISPLAASVWRSSPRIGSSGSLVLSPCRPLDVETAAELGHACKACRPVCIQTRRHETGQVGPLVGPPGWPPWLAPGDLRGERKEELQLYSQANVRRLVPLQCARRPQFDQHRVLHEKLNPAAGALGMSSSRCQPAAQKRWRPMIGGARQPLTPPSGVGSLKRRPLQSKCHAKEHVSCQTLGLRDAGSRGGRVGPLPAGALPSPASCRKPRPAWDWQSRGRSVHTCASAAGAAAPRGPRRCLPLYGRPRFGIGSPRLPLAQPGSSVLSRECQHRADVGRCGPCAPCLAP